MFKHKINVKSELPTSKDSWLQIYFVGFSLYVLSIVVIFLTENFKLFPAMLLLGNFLVPVTFVAYLYERQQISSLKLSQLAMSFFLGGVLSVFSAGLLEVLLLSGKKLNFVTGFQIGLIEEFAKIVAVMFVARKMRHNSQLNGLLLGAAVGMGFAALENTGYSFSIFLEAFTKDLASNIPQIFSVLATISAIALRSLLAPFGHGIWTAILSAVLFRESGAKQFHINLPVIISYIFIVLLHGLWDGGPDIVIDFSVLKLLPIGCWVVIVLDVVIFSLVWRQAMRRARLEVSDRYLLLPEESGIPNPSKFPPL